MIPQLEEQTYKANKKKCISNDSDPAGTDRDRLEQRTHVAPRRTRAAAEAPASDQSGRKFLPWNTTLQNKERIRMFHLQNISTKAYAHLTLANAKSEKLGILTHFDA